MAFLEYSPVSTVYHYTTKEGLIGILKSGELWLSDLSSSNDPRDIHLGIDTLQQLGAEVLDKEFSIPSTEVASLFLDHAFRYYKIARCYTLCLTMQADNINMWREYADSGRGLSIGFRPRAITDMHGRLYKTRYIDERSRDTLYNLVSEIFAPLKSRGRDILNDIPASAGISASLISLVNSIKHFTWSYEDEIRLTLARTNDPHPQGIPLSLSPDDRHFNWTPSKVRRGEGGEIHYLSLPFGKFQGGSNDPRKAIAEVIIGPNSSCSRENVTDLLQANGYSNFEIRASVCAFR